MFGQRPVSIIQVFDAESIAKSAHAHSAAIDLDQISQDGIFSLHFVITGDGTCKFEYELCHHKSMNYKVPSGATAIGSSLTDESGSDSDGEDILDFEPELSPSMKIKCTETGGANGVVVTAFLAIQ